MMTHRDKRQAPRHPIHHPFIEISGDIYLMIDWFDLDDGTLSRDRIVLQRLTRRELALYDYCRATADGVAHVLPQVERRLRHGKPHRKTKAHRDPRRE